MLGEDSVRDAPNGPLTLVLPIPFDVIEFVAIFLYAHMLPCMALQTGSKREDSSD